MTDMQSHPDWDRLNDAADDRLEAGDADAMRMHLASCADCRATIVALRELGGAARTLESAIEPPADLWRDVSTSIAAGGSAARARTAGNLARADRDAHVDTAMPAPHTGAARYAFSMRSLAAAALFLVTLTSGITAYVMRSRGASAPPAVARENDSLPPRRAPDGANRVLPASFAAAEAAYLVSVADLHAAFVAQRNVLSPATVAVVERSLTAIDGAIAEARAALVADPANQALAELLSTTYRQKVELLRRAAEYSAS